MAAVDATEEAHKKNALRLAYREVQYFLNGELAFNVGNAREEDAIVDSGKDPEEPLPPST